MHGRIAFHTHWLEWPYHQPERGAIEIVREALKAELQQQAAAQAQPFAAESLYDSDGLPG